MLGSVLKGATVTVETAVAPPFTVALDDAVGGPPSPLVVALKPRIEIRVGGVLVVPPIQPHGDPRGSPLKWALPALAGLVAVGGLVAVIIALGD